MERALYNKGTLLTNGLQAHLVSLRDRESLLPMTASLILDEANDRNRVLFLWCMVCKFITCPISARPSMEYLPLAHLLASGEKCALGSILLASVYQCLAGITHQDFRLFKGSGPLWVVQMWLLTYFPELADRDWLPTPYEVLGMRVVSLESDRSPYQVTKFLTQLPATDTERFKALDQPSDLVTAKLPGFWCLEGVDRYEPHRDTWASFTAVRHLHIGVTFDVRLGVTKPGLELYMPSLWSRQFGCHQGIPTLPELANERDQPRRELQSLPEALEWRLSTRRKRLNTRLCKVTDPDDIFRAFLAWWTPQFDDAVLRHTLSSSGT